MIKRIELKNFMSHEDTVIEPAAGLTVLIGPNNVGKSAVIAALQILCYNDNSTYVMRHGTKQCSVKIETDDGHTVEWHRKKSPSYIIDGQKFDRLARSGTPEELHQVLKLPKVAGSGNDEFDVHFGSQKSPIFLLDESGATAARFFASSSDAIRLVSMQQRHKEKVRDAKKERTRLDLESKRLNAELAALDPIIEIERRVEKLEADFSKLNQLEKTVEELSEIVVTLEQQEHNVTSLKAEVSALQKLQPVPVITPTEPLENLTSSLVVVEEKVDRSNSLLKGLSQLKEPPVMGDTVILGRRISDLSAQERTLHFAEKTQSILRQLTHPPELPSTLKLEELLDQLIESNLSVEFEIECNESLSPLEAVPELKDTRHLQELIDQLTEQTQHASQHRDRFSILKGLGSLEVELPTELEKIIDEIKDAARTVGRHQAQLNLLNIIPPLEVEDRYDEIEQTTINLKEGMTEVEVKAKDVDALNSELMALEETIAEVAADQSCPVCGGELNVDQLLEQAGRARG